MSEQDRPGTTAQCTGSVIGLGNMGSALARAFLANRHSVTVWNRSVDKAALLAKQVPEPPALVAQTVAASDVVYGPQEELSLCP